ncbi:IS5 family transposase [Xanthobacter sediminis]
MIQGRFRREAALLLDLMSDEKWAFFEPFVTTRGPHSGRRPRDRRRVLDGVFWIARTGAQWRDLPNFFGKWSSVYRQFRRWTLSGLRHLLLEVLNAPKGVGVTLRMIDSPLIRAHHCAAGARGARALRGGFSTKIHLRTNGAGRPVAVDIVPGQASDDTGALSLLDADGPQPKVFPVDRGYDAVEIRAVMEARGVTPIIPMRRCRKVQFPIDGHVYALRNRIERCFNKLRNWRRPATRKDKTADSDLGFVLIAAVRIWIRIFVNRT